MKKIIALVLSLILCVAFFAGCSNSKPTQSDNNQTEVKNDWDYIADKGELIIGYTIYEPMNFLAADGTLTGFDTEFAQAVCEKLGVKAKFVEINWDTKEFELNSKNIDCIWNGFTVNAERKEQVDFSLSYLINKQVIVVKASNAEKYATIDKMAGASIAAEKESAGQAAIKGNAVLSKNPFTPAEKQTDVLLELKSGTTEIGVIDYIMALATVGEGTDYADLIILENIQLAPEEYAIGLRKNSTATLEKVNAAINALAADGTLKTIAAKYYLADKLAEGLSK